MGPRRQFVGGWTILRGPRPPSVQWPQSRRNVSAVDDPRQGSRPSTSWQRLWEDERFQQVSNFVSESGRTSCSSSVSCDEARSCHPSCRRGRSCSSGIGGGFAESPLPSAVAAGPRPDKSHRGISKPGPEEVRDHGIRLEGSKIKRRHHRIGVENPGWRTPIGRIKNRSKQKWKPMVPGMGLRNDRNPSSSWRFWMQRHEVER